MLDKDTSMKIHQLTYEILGSGSHSDLEIASAKATAFNMIVFGDIIEKNTLVMNKLIELIEQRRLT